MRREKSSRCLETQLLSWLLIVARTASDMIDSHCHLDFLASGHLRESYLKSAHDNGLAALVIPATNLGSWSRLEELRQSSPIRPQIHIALGVHPWFVDASEVFALEQLELDDWPDCSAIGECGLDGSPRGLQRASRSLQVKAFELQIRVARELKLPLIFHQVGLAGLCLELLGKDAHGIIHGFQGSPGLAREYNRRGFLLGVGTQLLNKGRSQLRAAAQELPLESLVLETDEIVPSGHKPYGDELLRVARELALLRGEKLAVICEVTQKNAEICFNFAA